MVERREEFIDAPYEAPQEGLEQKVADIVADVLGVDRVGRNDGFYDFGGSSLQAVRICVRIDRDLGLQALPLWLFSNDILYVFVEQLRAGAEQSNA